LSFLISGLIYLCISFLLYIGVVEYKLIYLLQENLLTNKTVTPQIHKFIKHRLGNSLLQFLQAINFYNRCLNRVLRFIETGLFVGFIKLFLLHLFILLVYWEIYLLFSLTFYSRYLVFPLLSNGITNYNANKWNLFLISG